MALLTLDEYRIEGRRDGLCCCIIHHTNTRDRGRFCSDQTKMFEVLANQLVKGSVKLLVAILTLLLLIAGVHGITSLKMEFKPEWLMDPAAEG